MAPSPAEEIPMGTAASIRTLVAEDVHLMRRGLVALLSHETDIDVVAEVERGDRVVPVAMSREADVAIIDSDLPGMDGFSAARLLAERLPECRSLLMTENPRVGDVRRVVAARAYGLVPKETPALTMANAIRRVANGGKVVDADLAFAALDAAVNPLSARETEVLQMAALGAPADEIADKLCLTVGTVRNYLTRIIRKLGARNRIDAIRIANEQGWI
jgi:two-component system, NarL family, response regulator DesR